MTDMIDVLRSEFQALGKLYFKTIASEDIGAYESNLDQQVEIYIL